MRPISRIAGLHATEDQRSKIESLSTLHPCKYFTLIGRNAPRPGGTSIVPSGQIDTNFSNRSTKFTWLEGINYFYIIRKAEGYREILNLVQLGLLDSQEASCEVFFLFICSAVVSFEMQLAMP